MKRHKKNKIVLKTEKISDLFIMNKLYHNIKIICGFYIIIFIFPNCNEVAKAPITADTHCKCGFKITPANFDSLHINVSFDDLLGRIRFSLRKEEEEETNNFKGVIKSIEETTSEINIRFDEIKEDLQKKTIYKFNKKGLLDTIKYYTLDLQNINLKTEVVFKYYTTNLLSSKTYYFYSYRDTMQSNTRYTYSESGLKIKESGSQKEAITNFYENYQAPYKQIVTKRPYGGLEPTDSTVVKYLYDSCVNLKYLYVYSANGKRKSDVNFEYSERNNSLSMTQRDYELFSLTDETSTVYEIIFYMDSNCTIKEITEVQMIDKYKNEKKFSRISLNKYNDVTEIESFKLKTPDNIGLDFIRVLDNYKPEFLERSNIQIQYDSRVNWIIKKINDKTIIRRKIIYRE